MLQMIIPKIKTNIHAEHKFQNDKIHQIFLIIIY